MATSTIVGIVLSVLAGLGALAGIIWEIVGISALSY
ncbi:hypothetical protein CFELI_12715 [Corynebacterium felinum]|uniref:Uncharacterized protein n=1 Tax=Corynebacterium felinum TaxID=131318 RepID=A0ABU2B5R2_9CORY|nr:hypothetical protein [Corynebacterium felinum]WJY96122.1 hypothetical protein CFELI_12715 [Corynebacterium felinum]